MDQSFKAGDRMAALSGQDALYYVACIILLGKWSVGQYTSIICPS